MLLLHQRTEYQDSYRDPDEIRRQLLQQQQQEAKAPPKKKKQPEIFSIAPQTKPQQQQQPPTNYPEISSIATQNRPPQMQQSGADSGLRFDSQDCVHRQQSAVQGLHCSRSPASFTIGRPAQNARRQRDRRRPAWRASAPSRAEDRTTEEGARGAGH